MKVLGIDVGRKRIGLAISDDEGKFAFPLEVIEVEGEESAIEKIKEIGEREGAKIIVVGIPYSLKGTITPSTQFAQLIARRLREEGLEVEEIDERLTTREAEKMIGRGKKKGKTDKIAAALLLQVYLQKLGGNKS